MPRILVPCDFSTPALEGLQFAVELSVAAHSTITVLSVISPQQQKDELFVSEDFRKHFENVRSGISQAVQIHQEIRTGKLVSSVLSAVTEENIDLIVIGTRGSRGWEGAFMGSNVEKIVRTSPVPVFAVKKDTRLNGLKDIVFPCDLVQSDYYGLAQLKKLQAGLGARLHLLRVNTSGIMQEHFLADRIKDYARFHQLSNYTVNIVTDPDEKDGILRFAKEISADLIAMTTHGAADLNHLYMSSIAADVVNHSHLLTWTCIQQPVNQPVR